MNQFFIYKITNKVTGKYYIGQTKNLYNRMKSHKACKDKGTIITKSISKYGWENHSVEVLFFGENISVKDGDLLEIKYIAEHNSFCKENKMGMNLTKGGFRGSVSLDYNLMSKKADKRWMECNGKSGMKIVVLSEIGEELFICSEFSELKNIFPLTAAQKSCIKKAILLRHYYLMQEKFIIGFNCEDPFAAYLQFKEDRLINLRNTPMTERRVGALLRHHKEKHSIPVLDLQTGVFYETMQEFSQHEERTASTIKERFENGKYQGRYLICKN